MRSVAAAQAASGLPQVYSTDRVGRRRGLRRCYRGYHRVWARVVRSVFVTATLLLDVGHLPEGLEVCGFEKSGNHLAK
jgi:hypothetical protein